MHPTTLVVFGATGDLSCRKLLPALYNLAHEGALPERFELVGMARGERPDEDFREMARVSIERFSRRRPDRDVLDGLLAEMRFVPGAFDDDEVYGELDRVLREFDDRAGYALNRVFYLATAPQFFRLICEKLGAAGLQPLRPSGHEDRDREAVRPRPRLGARAERARALRVRGIAGVPDRSLPGQGDRSEPDGAAVRQRAV